MKNSIFSPLEISAYRKLFISQFFSDLGNWFDFTIISVLLIYKWHLGPSSIAWFTLSLGIPWVFVGPIMSVWVDRLPRRTVLIATNLLRVIIVIGFTFSNQLATLLPLVFLKESMGAIFDPAKQGMIKELVPEEILAEANSLSQISVNTTKIIGPALGGLLVAYTNTTFGFYVEALGFLIGMLAAISLPKINIISSTTKENVEKTKDASVTFWSQFKEGFVFIRSKKILFITILITASTFFLVFLYDGLLILLSKALGFSEKDYGYLISSIGFGSVIGSFLFGNWTTWKSNPLFWMSFYRSIGGILIIVTGLGGAGIIHLNVSLWVLITLLIGIISTGSTIPYSYILQTETPPHLMGRVSATANAFQTLSMLIAPMLGAFAVKWIGTGPVFILSGIGTVLLGLGVLPMVSRFSHSTENTFNSKLKQAE